MSPQGRLLILGGTGFVGQALCEQLARHAPGTAITVPTRRLRNADSVKALPQVTAVPLGSLDTASLQSLVAGHDAVVNLIAILQGSAAQFQRVHVDLPTHLGEACMHAGVRRLVHVSALGASASAPSNYLRSKAAGEAALQADKSLALTVMRPSIIVGAGDRFLNLFAALQTLVPVLPLAGARSQYQPLWVGDVAAAIATALSRGDAIGRTYELAGPQVFTLAELVRMAGRLSGHPRPILPLPHVLAWLQACLMELAPGEPLMSRDNLQSMRVPNVASGKLPGLADLGIHATAVQDIAAQTLGPQGRNALRIAWRQQR